MAHQTVAIEVAMSTFNRKRQIMEQEPSTQNEIIEMATQVYGECDWHESALLHLERFAKLVAAKEREACAKMVEDYMKETAIMEARGCLASVAYDIRARRGQA